MSTQWKPSEIVIHRKVENDPVTQSIVSRCEGIPIKFVSDAYSKSVVQASEILRASDDAMLDKILAGKQVLFISPATGGEVDQFEMKEQRMLCPHFLRLKYAMNGCFYQCDWCYLKLTYRTVRPFITVKAEYDRIIEQIEKKLNNGSEPQFLNSGEFADSLSLGHLTGAARRFIPWFGTTENGYLFLLTKSDNVDEILNLPHNGHTIIAWSMNNELVSRKFETGAPSFERRLNAAQRVQEAGYPLRVRLDPIVPLNGWQEAYAETIEAIFVKVRPERITLGTLRFEDGFYKMRDSIFKSGPELPTIIKDMQPMFEPKLYPGKKRPSVGKRSFSEERRVEIFNFAINEIRKYSDCKIALCKESANVWDAVDLSRSECSCDCQFDFADMS